MKYETFYAKEQALEKVKELQELGHYVDWWAIWEPFDKPPTNTLHCGMETKGEIADEQI